MPRTTPAPSPITSASGTHASCSPASPQPPTRRRLLPVGLRRPHPSPGARALYDRQPSAADHHQALRALANRLVGILHGCLDTNRPTTKRSPGRTPPRPRRLTVTAVGCLELAPAGELRPREVRDAQLRLAREQLRQGCRPERSPVESTTTRVANDQQARTSGSQRSGSRRSSRKTGRSGSSRPAIRLGSAAPSSPTVRRTSSQRSSPSPLGERVVTTSALASSACGP